MKITTVLFDLDGTLLPMDADVFIKDYFGRMSARLLPHGYDPKTLYTGMMAGIQAMMTNTGAATNETAFWQAFSGVLGEHVREDMALFEDFYRNEFQEVRHTCGFAPEAAETVRWLKSRGIRVALATAPLFPAIATESRIRWAGLEPEEFELYTTYEHYSASKPNLAYYRDVVNRLGVDPAECIMVGNDATEDLVAAELGMGVFLLTDCLINREHRDVSAVPQGGFPQLRAFLEEILDK